MGVPRWALPAAAIASGRYTPQVLFPIWRPWQGPLARPRRSLPPRLPAWQLFGRAQKREGGCRRRAEVPCGRRHLGWDGGRTWPNLLLRAALRPWDRDGFSMARSPENEPSSECAASASCLLDTVLSSLYDFGESRSRLDYPARSLCPKPTIARDPQGVSGSHLLCLRISFSVMLT